MRARIEQIKKKIYWNPKIEIVKTKIIKVK